MLTLIPTVTEVVFLPCLALCRSVSGGCLSLCVVDVCLTRSGGNAASTARGRGALVRGGAKDSHAGALFSFSRLLPSRPVSHMRPGETTPGACFLPSPTMLLVAVTTTKMIFCSCFCLVSLFCMMCGLDLCVVVLVFFLIQIRGPQHSPTVLVGGTFTSYLVPLSCLWETAIDASASSPPLRSWQYRCCIISLQYNTTGGGEEALTRTTTI